MSVKKRLIAALLLLVAVGKSAEAWIPVFTRASFSARIRRAASASRSHGGVLPLTAAAITDADDALEAASAPPASSSLLTRKPVEGDVVTVKCRLKPEGDFVPDVVIDGIVLHDEAPPAQLSFLLHRGNYLPGLHDLVSTLMPGDVVKHVSLDAGWGARNPALTATLTYADAGVEASQIQPGMTLRLENGLTCVVTAATDGNFTIDANPPLAGASYLADVELLAVEQGPEAAMPYGAPSSGSGSRYEIATFALGCFWGAELASMREVGVVGTAVGYTQGSTVDPTYEQVCSGTTGHAEAVLITFDPLVTSYDTLIHAAMDRLGEYKYLLNQVGNDRGTQYRHGIYYHTAAQKIIAESVIAQYGEDCVTECLPASTWYAAEEFHQQYLLKGGQSARKGDATVIRCYG